MSTLRTTIIAAAACACATSHALAGGVLEEIQTQVFEFPLSPGNVLLPFNQFDEQGGARELLRVRVDLDVTVGAAVTAENESALPAPDFGIMLSGFGTLDMRDISTFTGFSETFTTDGSIGPSDGIPGAGRDFWDFGTVTASVLAGGVEETNLAPFIGLGTIDADVFASGGFSALGATDSLITIDDFGVNGTVTVTYEYTAMLAACCLPSGACIEIESAACTAMGGEPQAAGTTCADVMCDAPPTAADRVGCTEKGSLLVFSKVELRWTDGGAVLQDTFLSLTNDFPTDVKVQLYFINGDPPLPADPTTGERAHPGWNRLDNELLLTGNQPTYWSALSGQPAAGGLSPFTALDPGFPPGRPAPDGSGERVLRGYVLAWAVNVENEEIRWNHLTGGGTIVRYDDGGMAWEYNACAYQAVAAAHGQQTGTPGVLNLDGIEYASSFNELLLDFQAVGSAAFSGPRLVTSDTDITLHPADVDLRQETDGPVTTKASYNVWNMNEVKFSGLHRCITCWDQTLASFYGTPNHLLLQNLQTDHGKARIDGLASHLCDTGGLTSVDAALHGLAARLLFIDGELDAASGMNLVGMGYQSATIKYDVLGSPDEAQSEREKR